MGLDFDYSPYNTLPMVDEAPQDNVPAGWVVQYIKSDGNIYTKGSSGDERSVSGDSWFNPRMILTDGNMELVDRGDILYDEGVTA